MDEWFDHQDIDHFITHYGRKGLLTWNSVVFLEGRYILKVRVKVEIDYNNCEIRKVVGEPKIFLHELESLGFEGGRVIGSTIKSDGLPQQYGPEKWRELELKNGDLDVFSTLGEKVKKNNPIERFEEYRQVWGKDRIGINR